MIAGEVDPARSAASATRRCASQLSRAVPPGTRGGHRGRIFGASAKSTWVRDGPACARSNQKPVLAESKKPGRNWEKLP
jgi:hypothetical protein